MSRFRPALVKSRLKRAEFAVDRLGAAPYLLKRLRALVLGGRYQVGNSLSDEAVEGTRDANQAREELREFGRSVFAHYAATFSHGQREVKKRGWKCG